MPEGDTLHRAAQRLQALVGECVEVEAPHPRAAATGVAPRIDGKLLEGVEAVGKHLLLRFQGGLVLRSHLRMSGRWRVEPRGTPRTGRPWLVLRGATLEAVLWNGPVLSLDRGPVERLGPDILAPELDLDAIVARFRRQASRAVGDVLLDQHVVAGIGNMWKAEALWQARLSPWQPVRDCEDMQLRDVLGGARRTMQAALAGPRPRRSVYRRAGRPCPRCGEPIRSRGQGDDNRIAYWCPGCQAGAGPPTP